MKLLVNALYRIIVLEISDIFRVIQYADELILLELYICD